MRVGVGGRGDELWGVGGRVLSGPVLSGLVLCVRNGYFAIIVYQLGMTKKKHIIM